MTASSAHLTKGRHAVLSAPVDILVVGGRATGTAALVQLVQRVPAESTITVVDPADGSHPAVFDDPHPLLLANTSAGLNSLFPDRPGDFTDFARCGSDDVVQRSVIGRYYADRAQAAVAQAAQRGVSVHRIAASCRSVAALPGTLYEAKLSNGQRVRVTEVVIAVGVGPVRQPHGIAGIPPFPSARLLRHAGPNVLVVGQGQSAIDAALVLCEAGSRVVMTSRTGWFPAVRTRTLPGPFHIGHTDTPVDLRGLVNHDCLAKGFPPLDDQFSHIDDPVERLREEIELAEANACPWQDSIVATLDLVASHKLAVNKDKEFVWRHVTAMILPNARRLLSLLDAGQIRVENLSTVDPATFDLVVTATGFTPPPLHHTDSTLYLSDPPQSARPVDQLDPHLRIQLNHDRGPERIWAIGPASWPRAPFAAFLRTVTSQARWVAQQIATDSRRFAMPLLPHKERI